MYLEESAKNERLSNCYQLKRNPTLKCQKYYIYHYQKTVYFGGKCWLRLVDLYHYKWMYFFDVNLESLFMIVDVYLIVRRRQRQIPKGRTAAVKRDNKKS